MAPTSNGFGVLLLQQGPKKKVSMNPAFGSLNVVYTPPEGANAEEESTIVDLSGIPIQFQSSARFSKIEKVTR